MKICYNNCNSNFVKEGSLERGIGLLSGFEMCCRDVAGFEEHMKVYISALEAERKAVETIKM